MILTEQEVDALRKSLPAVCKHQDVIRAAESAVIEKLKEQEPVAWLHTFEKQNGSQETDAAISYAVAKAFCDFGDPVPLYTHPLPPDDVVRDAERYRWINVADRLPDPEISVLVAREGRRFAEKSCHTGKEWLLESNHFPVTHWMPLPMTPQTRSEWEQMHAGIKRAAIDAAMKEMK